MTALRTFSSTSAAYFAGIKAAILSVFFFVLAGTYVGIGALAHDFGFSSTWLAATSVIIWAGPAQVILISSLGAGGAAIEAAIAVTLSAIRLLPMVVALLPLLRTEKTRLRDLILPTHFTSISMWMESLRLLPSIEREHRLAFCNGLASAYMSIAVIGGYAGYYLAAGLPPVLAGTLLFLTPMSFLVSTARNCRILIDRVAFALGLVLGPLFAWYGVELDLLWAGIAGGAIAYAVHRVRKVAA